MKPFNLKKYSQSVINLSYEDWERTYRPVYVHKDSPNGRPEDLAPLNGKMFETFGEELEKVLEVKERDPFKIWTILDDMNTIINGFNLVNRQGYFICRLVSLLK